VSRFRLPWRMGGADVKRGEEESRALVPRWCVQPDRVNETLRIVYVLHCLLRVG
jgi:hypothetical protein